MSDLSLILKCPICKRALADGACAYCKVGFKNANSKISSFICRDMYGSDAEFNEALKVIDFWGNGWKRRLAEPEHSFLFVMDEGQLRRYATDSADWCRLNQTLMGVEVPLGKLQDKIALNIGCGAGTEALILSQAGASCVAMDITEPAATATNILLGKIEGGVAIQGDARFIPLADESVDIVYSSGVLHHSSDIQRSISEIHRVLKPGGEAYVMLYAKWSITFMQEKLFNWTGEKAWETDGRKNPLTTTYSVKDCKALFSNFDQVEVSKRGASLQNFAKIGRFMPTMFDSLVNRPLGANLNIVAKKVLCN